MTPTELREYVMSAPDPLDGPAIWDRPESQNKGEGGMRDGYEVSCLAAAKAMLIVAEGNPGLLAVPSKEDDPTGVERAFADGAWQAAKERWPGLNDWLGGISGFQFGWANNAVREILGHEPVGNPAIVTLVGTE